MNDVWEKRVKGAIFVLACLLVCASWYSYGLKKGKEIGEATRLDLAGIATTPFKDGLMLLRRTIVLRKK